MYQEYKEFSETSDVSLGFLVLWAVTCTTSAGFGLLALGSSIYRTRHGVKSVPGLFLLCRKFKNMYQESGLAVWMIILLTENRTAKKGAFRALPT